MTQNAKHANRRLFLGGSAALLLGACGGDSGRSASCGGDGEACCGDSGSSASCGCGGEAGGGRCSGKACDSCARGERTAGGE